MYQPNQIDFIARQRRIDLEREAQQERQLRQRKSQRKSQREAENRPDADRQLAEEQPQHHRHGIMRLLAALMSL